MGFDGARLGRSLNLERFLRMRAAQQHVVTSVKVVEKDVSEEVAKGQAAMGGSFAGSTSISGSVSSAMPSICM